MKILLIAVNQEKHPYPVQPLGAAYIAATLRAKGLEVKIVDLCFVEDFQKELLVNLKEFSPQLIGFSIRNIDNTSFPNTKYYLPGVKKIVDFCKENIDAYLTVGGSGLSVMPKEVLQYLELNTGVVGEGEDTLYEIVEKIDQKRDIRDTKGIVYFENDTYIENKADYTKNRVDGLLPDRDLLDIKRYMAEGSITNIQTKRGCGFKCIYCTYPIIEGEKIRLRSPRSVAIEIEMLNKKYGIDYFYFIDSIFNFPIDHAMEICEEIIKKGLKIKWTAFFHPKFITKELVALLVQSGCSGVEFGIDSASERILENLKKGFFVKEVIKASSICKKAGLNVCCYLLIGGPGEDRESLKETFEVMEDISPTAIIAQSGVRIYPGTEIEKIAVAEGYDLENYLPPKFYISRELKDNLVKVIQEFIPSHPNFIYEGLGEEIPVEILKRMRKMGIKGPLWELKGKA
ncbi:MAG: lipid biosynthesis B12-binding/radical SAM protein [bacterium]|nr:lipid biosynthesis B12-binding/radical SAM protein [bacterium]